MRAEEQIVEPRLWDVLVGVVASLTATLIPGPIVIRWLRSRFRERIVSDSRRLDELHAAKTGTPTMGGVLIAAGLVVGLCVCPVVGLGWELRCQALVCLLTFTILGACDDYVKAVTGRKGLTIRQKLAWQLVLGGVMGLWLEWSGDRCAGLEQWGWDCWAGAVWTMLWVVAASNAVNLTDGLDGLAAGGVVLSGAALAAGIFFASANAEWCVIPALAAAAAGGFLWYNRHPARVFMGDAGALPLGAVLGFSAAGAGVEWGALGCGFVFFVEMMSVVLQVLWYRRTQRRLLLCSPLHNHFVFAGVAEQRIVGWFWLCGLVFGVLSVWLMVSGLV